ncbi:MAG: transcriptional regulator [Methanobrevibacter sp.]|jgi:predicted transcriptional regulator|nr:transcriptional regulator [Candidatus Methanoflexus mossambicus]
MNSEKVEKIGFVKASIYRNNILLFLGDKMRKPSEIANHVEISITNVSRYLKDLMEINFIECLNPDAKMGRMYSLTEEGKDILQYLEPMKKKSKKV